ncbi:hypothetical protein HanRHA438_Chr11g0526071 [Helianthus annuus]|uniref:Uncharacterized protein n=1 Tax=Helianthus annuus TaxID=4232 RepID=A0A251TDC9_HELAN|nr:hypothetical protein HanXRQr2_Chr11g0514091 [Helianthus annuus]KAJ0519175.1 hypothetical protein HanHA89_Chr11g0445831 [Helianthus annuus]KAJ0690969.1 hypothetical protein HanOQP8_Chr11g0423861 [Helianthus annuus]KAJ0872637.1 hypothetical protein HanRHA438_Chr11g0526071 [Helianthus annuus]
MPFALSSLPLQNTTHRHYPLVSSHHTPSHSRSREPLQPPHAAPSITQTISSADGVSV